MPYFPYLGHESSNQLMDGLKKSAVIICEAAKTKEHHIIRSEPIKMKVMVVKKNIECYLKDGKISFQLLYEISQLTFKGKNLVRLGLLQSTCIFYPLVGLSFRAKNFFLGIVLY